MNDILQTRDGESTPLTRYAQLWTSDGTPEGSEPVTAIQQGVSSDPSSFTPFGDRVLFPADGITKARASK